MRLIRVSPSAFAARTVGLTTRAIQPVSASVSEFFDDSVVPFTATSCTKGHSSPSGSSTCEVPPADDGTDTVEVSGLVVVLVGVVVDVLWA
ncbi:hypothetical protein [Dietzia psychralcaliphila]|uniref:hypothetical protein n=1 Tax=Dietzia psychralcaliphila TaxID=139021 RepID=UPI0020112516|nr:hypothetical protein [Dietzia psychralcaliphila]